MAKDIWGQLEALNKTNAENEAAAKAETKSPPKKKKKKKKKPAEEPKKTSWWGGLIGRTKLAMENRNNSINKAVNTATERGSGEPEEKKGSKK